MHLCYSESLLLHHDSQLERKQPETNTHTHTRAAAADLCCSSCCGQSSANILQQKSHKFHSAVTLSKGKAISVNLSVLLLRHLICSRPPRGPSSDRENSSVQTLHHHHTHRAGILHGKVWSSFRLFISFPVREESINPHATSAVQSNSLSRGTRTMSTKRENIQ